MSNLILKFKSLSIGLKTIAIIIPLFVVSAIVATNALILEKEEASIPTTEETSITTIEKTTIKEEQTTIETESNTLKAKSAYEFLGVTYKEIVDCFGNGYTWREGFGVPNMWYPDNILTYGLCFGTVPDMVVESSPVTSVLVSAQGKELYKGVCIGDDISDLERVTGQAAYQYFDEMEGVNSYSIEIENVTVWGYLEGTKILTATLKQAV